MITALSEPAEIGRYLQFLREQDRAAIGTEGDAAQAIAKLLDAHTVVMAHGVRADDEPVEESLATWLSLLDDDAWRVRVREVRVDATHLREPELELLERLRG
jgi:hypothetical protein